MVSGSLSRHGNANLSAVSTSEENGSIVVASEVRFPDIPGHYAKVQQRMSKLSLISFADL